MTEHARFFQASGAARWMACPASVGLSVGLPDESSEYAEEGTRAHDLAAAILTGGLAGSVEPEMMENVYLYTDAVLRASRIGALMVEQRVDFSEDIGQPESFGTADAIVLVGDELQVHDLKYGMGVKVDAENNPQLMLYALGALRTYDMLGPFNQVRLVIHQVRLGHVSEWLVPVTELHRFAGIARHAAAEALTDAARIVPGEKQCRFCKAKAHCPTLAAQVAETIGADFENLDAVREVSDEPARMGLNYLAHCMASVELVEVWCKAIRARVERELLAGNTVDGWKLVQGRKGARKWQSDEAAEATLRKMKLRKEDMFDLKLISPTSAEKLHKSGVLGPRKWVTVQGLITQVEGSISVAPATDKRPAVTPTATASDFENLND